MITQIHLLEILSNKEKYNHNYGGFYLGHDDDQVIFGFTLAYPIGIDSFDEMSITLRDDNFKDFAYYSDNKRNIRDLNILNSLSIHKDYFSPNEYEMKLIDKSSINQFYSFKFNDNLHGPHNVFIRNELIYSNYIAQWLKSDD
jgi:hypothetical protein